MNDFDKLLVGSLIGFGCGIASGVLLEKWRERRNLRRTVLNDYISGITRDGADQDEYRRFAVLQRSGAWRLNQRELEELADEICGRGFRHPYEAWAGAFPEMKRFPRDFLRWAKKSSVDLSDPDAALRKIAEEYDARQLPDPPLGPGVSFL
jgi:hypothetical protein